MNCENCQALLTDYVHGEVDAASDAAVFQHLHGCATCESAWQAELALTESLRSAFAVERDFPTSILAGVRQAVRAEKAPGAMAALRALLRPAVLAPAAALIIAGAGIVHYNQAHITATSPQLSAEYLVRQHIVQTGGTQASERAWNGYMLTTANANDTNLGSP
ncbi:MAG: hypothetical protein DLM53_08770 [Candidatus Eremiobacter antarcticus]|nr:zf-HC2 domain-containing protein [Candidatus Eremiobacteraeota bacterium]PZR61315.1 MAG: hypothetical protein DLM53_08770 [Candidatus Eremiobacter sp. RRmetagenome_bin22]